MTRAFAYHRAIAPMMWVLVVLGVGEAAIVHALVASRWPLIAVGLSVPTLLGIAWLVRAILSFRGLPVEVAEDGITMRVGTIRAVTVDPGNLAGVRLAGWTAVELRARSTLNLALIAYPNVVLDLREPLTMRRGRTVAAIAHRLDDPAGFTAALERLGAGA